MYILLLKTIAFVGEPLSECKYLLFIPCPCTWINPIIVPWFNPIIAP